MSLLCPTEHRAVWRFHHVQRLWPAAAEGPEEGGGRSAEAERRAERRTDKGEPNQRVQADPDLYDLNTSGRRGF